MFFLRFDKEYAYLVQYPHRNRNNRQGNNIRSRGNYSGDNDNYDNRVFAVFAHKAVRDESEFSEKPAQDRHLEHDAHRQAHGHERSHVRLQGNHICHITGHLIRAEKSQSQGEYQIISSHHPEHERHVSAADHPDRIRPFVGI